MREKFFSASRLAALTIMIAALVPTAASAATFYVTMTGDPVPNGCTATDCSLREAVIAANANPGYDYIYLLPGTTQLSLSGYGENNSATGDLDITDSVIIYGNDSKIIAGQIDRIFHVINANGTLPKVQLVLDEVELSGGDAHGDSGGCIYAQDLTDLVLLDARVGDCVAWNGGGIYADKLYAHTTTIIDNEAVAYGGGLVATDLTLSNSTIANNTAGYDGGGVSTNYQSQISIWQSTFSNNAARSGGGIEIYYPWSAEINNSTFSGNDATTSGGAVYLSSSASATITQSTIVGNSAPLFGSGGISNGAATIKSSIVLGNTGGDCGSGIIGNRNNLFWEPAPGTVTFGTLCPIGVSDTTVQGPYWLGSVVSDLAHNGGPTLTRALPSGSPAIDGANTADCVSVGGVDQRDVTRGASSCDIGAYEY